MGRLNIVVLGLDETNLELLRRVPDADRYEFHGLMSIEDMQLGEDIPVADLLRSPLVVCTPDMPWSVSGTFP